jgi:tRNA (cytidine/uridine-2'-O-)-methyltransferase
MREQARSLNLSNAAAVAVYEVLRQNNFESMKASGELHRLSWR